MSEEQTTTHSLSYDHEGSEWIESSPDTNFRALDSNKISQALTLLDQIIEEEEINDKEFKKEMAGSSSIKDWEQSIGESWTLFHLKRLKDLLK